MAEEDALKLIKSSESALEQIRKEMGLGAKEIKKEPEAHASDLVAAKTVERKIQEQKKATGAPAVKCRPKRGANYDTQELFEKMAKAHQKIADSLKNKKGQSAKMRYHEELAEAYAFAADRGRDEEEDDLTRIPPLFKGALIMTMPEKFKGYY